MIAVKIRDEGFVKIKDVSIALGILPDGPKDIPGLRIEQPEGARVWRRGDDRRVIGGIVHVLRAGCRWQDCPPDYGPSTTLCNRFNRGSHRGLWAGIFTTLSARAALPEDPGIDATAVGAQRSAHGKKGGRTFGPPGARVAVRPPGSTRRQMDAAAPSPSP